MKDTCIMTNFCRLSTAEEDSIICFSVLGRASGLSLAFAHASDSGAGDSFRADGASPPSPTPPSFSCPFAGGAPSAAPSAPLSSCQAFSSVPGPVPSPALSACSTMSDAAWQSVEHAPQPSPPSSTRDTAPPLHSADRNPLLVVLWWHLVHLRYLMEGGEHRDVCSRAAFDHNEKGATCWKRQALDTSRCEMKESTICCT